MLSGYKTYLAALLTIVAAVLGCMTEQLDFEVAVEMIVPAILAMTLRHGIANPRTGRTAMMIAVACFVLLPGCAANEQKQIGQDSWQHVAIIVGPTDPTALYLTTVESEKQLPAPQANAANADADAAEAGSPRPGSQWGYHGNITITVSGKGEGSTSNGDVSQTPRADLQAEVSGNSAELNLPELGD